MIGALLACVVSGIGVTTIALEKNETATSALAGDLDGDGLLDLLLVVEREGLPQELRAHLRGPAGLQSVPAWREELAPNVVAYAIADVSPAEGNEVVLIAPDVVAALQPDAPADERFTGLAQVELLWQSAPDGPFAWQAGIVDLDGDGLDDVLLPEAVGYRALLQRREGDECVFAPFVLAVETEGLTDELEDLATAFRRLQPEATRESSGSLVEISASVPAPFVIDIDGDGRVELVAQNRERRSIWTWSDGSFDRREVTLPFEVDLQRELDVSWACHLGDLDGDGDLETVVLAREQRGDEDRTQVLVYGESFERPLQVILLQGLITTSRLLDVDGDGALDLVTFGLGDDLFESLRSGVEDEVEFTANVFANEGGQFARRPALVERIAIDPRADDEIIGLCADATGDGSCDFLRVTERGRLELIPLLARSSGWRLLLSTPVWQHELDSRARVDFLDGARARTAWIAIEPNAVVVFEVQ